MQTLRRIFTASLISPRKASAHALGRAAPFSASGLSQTVLSDSASLDLLSEQLKRDFGFYSEHTRDPIFRILPRNDGNTPAGDSLAAARVPEHEYASWSRSLHDASFSDIAHRVGQVDRDSASPVDPMDSSLAPAEEGQLNSFIPVWVLLGLAHALRSTDDAQRFAYLLLAAIPRAPEHYRPVLVLTAIRTSLALGAYAPLPRLVTVLCGLPIFEDPWSLDRFLSMAARYTNSSAVSHITAPWVQRVLEVIHERKLRLSLPTYRKLARNKYIAAELGKNLRLRKEGAPNVDELIHIFRHTRHERLARLAKHHDIDYHLRKSVLASTPRPVVEYLHALLDTRLVTSSPRSLSALERRSHPTYERQSAWLGRLAGMATDVQRVSSADLLSWFWQPRTAGLRNTYAYTILLNGLALRKDDKRVVRHYERMVKDAVPLDRVAAVTVVKALVQSGEGERALDFMNTVYKAGHLHRVPLKRQPVSPDGGLSREILNAFVAAMQHRRHEHMPFHVWDHGRAAFGSSPDADSLAAVLIAARQVQTHYESVSHSFRQALSGAGLLPRQKIDPRSLAETRGEALQKLREALHSRERYNWRGAPAAERARALFVHLLFEEHPNLRHVHEPQLVPSDRWTPRGIARRVFLQGTELADPVSEDAMHIEPLHLATSASKPTLITNATLRAYIHLLGPELAQARVLAWARELGFRDRRTIAFALVYFAEALSNEVSAGLTQGGEYHQLLRWVREWAGDGAPNDVHLAKAMEQVAGMRGRSGSQIVW
ncbi:hypothetical protein PENSPDRAFT_756121 [Peniophora sp. CONT]|nr:hypothetical protein PENSPDRAFT_756121 [Peniophora sp. CONT]